MVKMQPHELQSRQVWRQSGEDFREQRSKAVSESDQSGVLQLKPSTVESALRGSRQTEAESN